MAEDRSRLKTGYIEEVSPQAIINRRFGADLEFEETMDSRLVQHRNAARYDLMFRDRVEDPDQLLHYYPGVDVGCETCSDATLEYLRYYPEDREEYEDDDGELDWELMQEQLESPMGSNIQYAFHGDRGSKTNCANCGEKFFYTSLLDHMGHANAGGHPLREIRPSTSKRIHDTLHFELCQPCMDWFVGWVAPHKRDAASASP